MKKTILIFAAIIMVAGFSNKVMAQTTNTDEATADAFATIVAPIGITHSGADLQFGTVISGAGTVTVSTAAIGFAGRSFNVAGMNPGDQGVAPTAAVFTVTGEPTYTYSIVFTNSTEDLTHATVPADKMVVGTFLASTSSDGAGLTGTLNSGTDELRVGATLTVTTPLTAGVYAGSFEVTVAYN